MEQQEQQIFPNKESSKAIPIELLINIFKAIKTCPDEIEVQKNMNKIIKNEMFEKWNGYAKNVLTTTGIIYLVIREGFQKKKESDMAAKKLQLQKEADEKLRNAEYFERVYQWAKSSMTPVEDAVNAVGLLRQQQVLDHDVSAFDKERDVASVGTDLRLIEAMKNHHNYFQKTNWDKVSQEVGEEVDVLKKRWSQLKRKFYYEKSKTTSDWPFFDRMKFLDDDAGASMFIAIFVIPEIF
uniref:MADF domain-containing protein n=1 Tax=Meloidogyne hapla TaxID=6305 RepID=A0A1I8B2V2_MELHA